MNRIFQSVVALPTFLEKQSNSVNDASVSKVDLVKDYIRICGIYIAQ
ncbi:hypothetical protein VIBNISO65_1270014 [Vibrio nigripulchritudo SO65]|nr:hypothetical protein VIBNIAM115_200030 [Vibrio nigripulchritudo AM115]CCN44216.1 hypothetical protein VIBNIFTn2_720032 [Vibrio nigripulchritudo FTn2]CCN64574.1 hypothetical protein VIBNIPon4_230014 [Vibrio nigripulchritudo POn4]CCN75060.1 hypothetical protein VIBNISO65_1270014 [Vibrio nigripulchritudo SO65]